MSDAIKNCELRLIEVGRKLGTGANGEEIGANYPLPARRDLIFVAKKSNLL
jgi:hypothetical protein